MLYKGTIVKIWEYTMYLGDRLSEIVLYYVFQSSVYFYFDR